jgi:hypothetical protein
MQTALCAGALLLCADYATVHSASCRVALLQQQAQTQMAVPLLLLLL